MWIDIQRALLVLVPVCYRDFCNARHHGAVCMRLSNGLLTAIDRKRDLWTSARLGGALTAVFFFLSVFIGYKLTGCWPADEVGALAPEHVIPSSSSSVISHRILRTGGECKDVCRTLLGVKSAVYNLCCQLPGHLTDSSRVSSTPVCLLCACVCACVRVSCDARLPPNHRERPVSVTTHWLCGVRRRGPAGLVINRASPARGL